MQGNRERRLLGRHKRTFALWEKTRGLRPYWLPLKRRVSRGKVIPPRAFIVHGHDDLAISELKDYLQNTLKWDPPVVLREQPNRGRTIIEKFEELSGRIDCVFVSGHP